MRIINRGIMIGKLNIAISVKLFPALEAIAETIVNSDENPKLPRSNVIRKRGRS